MISPRVLVASLILVALPLLWGAPATPGGLIRDDVAYILANPHVTEDVGIATILHSPVWPSEETGLHRPLTTLSFRIDWIVAETIGVPITRTQAIVPHVHNQLLCGIAALLLMALLRRLGIPLPLAWAAGALLSAHPARSEAVLWISGRAEDLMCVFVLGALLVFAKRGGTRRLLVGGVLSMLALLSKEQGVVLVALAPLLPGLTTRRRWQVALAALAGVVPILLLRYSVVLSVGPPGTQHALVVLSFLERVGWAFAWIGWSALFLIVPFPLRHEYAEPASGPGGPWIAALLLGLAIVGWAPYLFRRQRRESLFGLGLFLLPLLPAMNVFVRSSEHFAERFLALPVAGGIALSAFALRTRARFGMIVLLAATLAGGGLTLLRAREYLTPELLFAPRGDWEDADAPEWALHAGLIHDRIQAARVRGDAPTAADHLAHVAAWREADRRAPHVPKYAVHLVRALLASTPEDAPANTDRLQEARRVADAAVIRFSDLAPAWFQLGLVSLRIGDTGGAERAFRRALILEPRDWRSGIALTRRILVPSNRSAEARGILHDLAARMGEAADNRPWDFGPLVVKGRILRGVGDTAGAINAWEHALERAHTAADLVRIATDLAAALRDDGQGPPLLRMLADLDTTLQDRIGTASPQADLLAQLANLAQLRGDSAAALRYTREALDAARDPALGERLRRAIESMTRR